MRVDNYVYQTEAPSTLMPFFVQKHELPNLFLSIILTEAAENVMSAVLLKKL